MKSKSWNIINPGTILLIFILSLVFCRCEPEKKNSIQSENIPAPPKPEPFELSTIPLPDSVMDAVLVNYLPDYEHIIMEVRLRGKKKSDLAIMKEDGSGFKCLTYGLNENIGGEMPVPLPDGKTVYTPTGVLECSPSIVDCNEARILPLIYPEIPGEKVIARIATNMSQDGIHVAYTLLTMKGSAYVLMSELTRMSDEKGDRYELTNTKIIAGDKNFEGDPANFRPFFYGNGEVKSFTEMGKSLMTISSFEANNYDLAKIDLSTGKVSRFTRHYSYDEGVYPSPDGNWIIFQTHRHTQRMDAFSLVPRPLIAGEIIGAGMAEYRNQWVAPIKNPDGDRRRFYGLTMLDKYGDRTRLSEDGYTGQNLSVADDDISLYTHFGNLTWHKSSTRGIFWEQKDPWQTKEGEQRGRLRMIRFTSRKPTEPLKVTVPDLQWATKLEDFQRADISFPSEGKLLGKVSGYAQIGIDSTNINEPMFRIEYHDFADDGEYILNGFEKRTTGSYFNGSHWFADVEVSGKRSGFLKADDVRLYFNKIGSGTIHAKLGEHEVKVDLAKGLPTGVPGELR